MIPTTVVHCKINKTRATQFFYLTFLKQHMTWPQNMINRWDRDLQTEDTDTKWETVCPQICYIIPVKLRYFYFKFMHRAIPHICTLYKMKIKLADYCRIRYNVTETFMHMFIECLHVPKFWKTIKDFTSISTANNDKMKIMTQKKCDIMLCTYNKENWIYTLISTIVKAYIFSWKYSDKTPNPVECWHKIKYFEENETLIYTTNS